MLMPALVATVTKRDNLFFALHIATEEKPRSATAQSEAFPFFGDFGFGAAERCASTTGENGTGGGHSVSDMKREGMHGCGYAQALDG